MNTAVVLYLAVLLAFAAWDLWPQAPERRDPRIRYRR
jgi:hypothetical protein